MRTIIHIAAALLAASVAGTALAAPADSGDSNFPVAFVDRPLTLPKLVLSPEFSLPVTHIESGGALGTLSINAVGLNLGASLGITDDLTVDLTPLTLLIVDGSFGPFSSQTKVYYGTFRLGATYRVVGKNAALAKSDVAEVGGRVEFGASGVNDTIHLSWGLPVILHFAHLVRIDTGLMFTGLFPVNKDLFGRSPPSDIAMASIGTAAPAFIGVAAPGIPLSITLGNDMIFGGVDTGFGIGSFRGRVADNCFMPLGAHLGGTIPKDHKPLLDLTAAFAFPYFLLGGANKEPVSQIWNVGVDAKAYFQL